MKYHFQFPDCEIYVIALSSTGEELWKFDLGKGYKRVGVCADDVDNNEDTEIIGFGYEASENWGKLFVLNNLGEYLHDSEVDYSIFPGAVGDIDGDGQKEIVALDSRGYLTVFTYDLRKESERYINENINSRSQVYLNDIDGDRNCEIILGIDKEFRILNSDLEDMWKKEFEDEIKFMITHLSGCKNTLLILSDKLYAFSYSDTGEPCPLWEITERELTEEATAYMGTAESAFAAGEYRISKTYFEHALAIFSQLEDEKLIDSTSEKITEVSSIIFKQNVKIGTISIVALDGFLCIFILYSWITKKSGII